MAIEAAERGWTTWHITWGTYGARLHGGDRPTVDRKRNALGDEFIRRDETRETREQRRLKGEIVILTSEQCQYIESVIPQVCERGGWRLRQCAAPMPPDDGDHVHVLLDVPSAVHGKRVREWLKRWITESLDGGGFDRPQSGRWWAVGGSTRVVDTMAYLHRVTPYIARQRATQSS